MRDEKKSRLRGEQFISIREPQIFEVQYLTFAAARLIRHAASSFLPPAYFLRSGYSQNGYHVLCVHVRLSSTYFTCDVYPEHWPKWTVMDFAHNEYKNKNFCAFYKLFRFYFFIKHLKIFKIFFLIKNLNKHFEESFRLIFWLCLFRKNILLLEIDQTGLYVSKHYSFMKWNFLSIIIIQKLSLRNNLFCTLNYHYSIRALSFFLMK